MRPGVLLLAGFAVLLARSTDATQPASAPSPAPARYTVEATLRPLQVSA